MASIVVKDLTLTYGSVNVLNNLNIDVAEGEFIVLLGPVGLRQVHAAQLHRGAARHHRGADLDQGQERHLGGAQGPRHRHGVPVLRALSADERARQPRFGLKNAGLPKADIDTRIARAAKVLQIEPLLDRKPAALSGGQRQRVAIGRALVRDVDVFLFDEPLSNLDAKLRSELRVEIKRLHAQLENTMVYVTHDQIEALTLADRIAVMRGGIIQQLADPKTIYNKPANLFVAGFIGSPAMTMLPGRVENGGGAAVFATGAERIPLAGYDGGTPAAVGRDAILGVRPEHIVIRSADAEGVAATVDIDEPMGSDSLVWLRLANGQTISVRTIAEHGFKPGQPVRLVTDISKASLFDKETEQRL